MIFFYPWELGICDIPLFPMTDWFQAGIFTHHDFFTTL